MRRLLYFIFFLVIWSKDVVAQTINFSNNSAYVIFSSDNENLDLDFQDDVIVNNTQNVVLQGKIYSDDSVVIKPHQNYSIVFKPQMPSPCMTCAPGDPPGTVIKPKPGGSGKIGSPLTVVYPVPVHTELNFTVSNYQVENFTIYDMFGVSKVSQNFAPPIQSYTIDVSGFANGNYILKLNLGNNMYASIQFIKN
ncbi:T9SS type A sorting domain-containing protein [Flavobacterium sp. CYK-4]|uniref:T9SS type A sorting domain-containing protein n=1 Tax=Flavobacterium lotistagni TaxID=2709660 RepID=UPI001408864C|nr:T9SS type A sorting domain-containing protein [Flavobacterium lotistagni]NHM05679.1 T9SS type A sorting domain-containing protein [Flavobacterium lotistagni]